MKKKNLVYMIVSAFFLVPSLCHAEDGYDFKKAFRIQTIEACMEEMAESDADFPPKVSLSICRCVTDKILEKYSVEELIKIDNYEGRIDEFMDDSVEFGTLCAIQAIKGKK